MSNSEFGAYSYSFSVQSELERSLTPRHENTGATVISAKFSDRNLLTVHVVADKLLTDCWAKGCEFARNFNASYVDIDHLLLGASHVRDAESALSAVCDDVEELTHQLARLCARRSFAETPNNNAGYEASQTLRVVLCEAAALAARQGVPHLTLSLVIEALAETDLRSAVIDVLPKLSRSTHVNNSEVSNVNTLDDLNGKIDNLDAMLDRQFQQLPPIFNHIITQKLGILEEYLRHNAQSIEKIGLLVQQNQQETQQCIRMSIKQPQNDFTNPTLPLNQSTLKIATAGQIYETGRTPSAVAAGFTNEEGAQQAGASKTIGPSHPWWRWFRFW